MNPSPLENQAVLSTPELCLRSLRLFYSLNIGYFLLGVCCPSPRCRPLFCAASLPEPVRHQVCGALAASRSCSEMIWDLSECAEPSESHCLRPGFVFLHKTDARHSVIGMHIWEKPANTVTSTRRYSKVVLDAELCWTGTNGCWSCVVTQAGVPVWCWEIPHPLGGKKNRGQASQVAYRWPTSSMPPAFTDCII